jgi:hypothetical protein
LVGIMQERVTVPMATPASVNLSPVPTDVTVSV